MYSNKHSNLIARSNKIFCLIGPSGTGKTAIADSINLPKVISYRTRLPREGEVDGVDGHFINKETFLKMDQENLWVAKTLYSGHYYGITQGELMPLEEKPMVYVIDWDGIIKLRKSLDRIQGYDSSQIVTIFINTSRDDLEYRMIKQGRDKTEIKARLDRIDRDKDVSKHCDYIVQNHQGHLNATITEILKIIIEESFHATK
ncbi:guanylate kinase [Bacillus cereus]|uniref:guanylate kinase n=1 Tax=Bacillus cereus TaxID=1396 RepID=UPI0006A8BB39|nr:Guanylate kinase [Bacillus subtilis]